MSRREEFLRQQREKAITEKVGKIYYSCMIDTLAEIGAKQPAIESFLAIFDKKVVELSKGYIGLDDYIESVEEKTGAKVK